MLKVSFSIKTAHTRTWHIAQCSKYLPVKSCSMLLVADSFVLSLIDDLVASSRSVDVNIIPSSSVECCETEIERARESAVLKREGDIQGQWRQGHRHRKNGEPSWTAYYHSPDNRRDERSVQQSVGIYGEIAL